jgi:ribosomal protein S18 acetylase RimI-like enzyme
VAVEQARVVGWLVWAARGKRVADLTWVGVAKAAQRRGIGSALVVSLVAHLQGLGVAELFVSTVADSVDDEPYARTRAFYRAVGFEDFRVDKGHFRDPRGDYDRLLMRRELAGDPHGPTK